ncbi:MAG: MFS transporter [Bacillota bacterium]|nr:MFS transporter [Bacillota bacterium]
MEKSFVTKLRFFMFLTSASSACFGPFLPVYYSSRKLTFAEMGIAFAINSIIGVAIQPLWGYISDKYLNKKKTLLIALIFNMIAVLAFTKAGSFGVILALLIVNGTFMCGIGPITDAYVFDVVDEKEGLSYSSFRFMSSAAWGVTNLILGFFIRAYGIDESFIIYDILAAGALIILFNMKYEGKKALKKVEIHDVKKVLKNGKLILFFLTIFLMNAAFIGGVNYMNELIKFTHGDVAKLGTVWFVTCTFEVASFIIASKLIRKIGMMKVYSISILVYGSKFILDFVFKNADYIIAVQVMEGIAFTLFITSSLEYLNFRTETKIRATAMSIYAAAGGLGAFSASLVGGFLLNMINPSQLYLLFGLLCFISFVGAVMLEPRRVLKEGL